MLVVITSLWGVFTLIGGYNYFQGNLSGTVFSICLVMFIIGCLVAVKNIRDIRKDLADKAKKE